MATNCICPIIGCKAHKGRYDTCIGCGRTQNVFDGRGCPWCREKRLEAIPDAKITHDEELTPAEEVMIDTAREREWELEDRTRQGLCLVCSAQAYPTPTGWQCAAYSNHRG